MCDYYYLSKETDTRQRSKSKVHGRKWGTHGGKQPFGLVTRGFWVGPEGIFGLEYRNE